MDDSVFEKGCNGDLELNCGWTPGEYREWERFEKIVVFAVMLKGTNWSEHDTGKMEENNLGLSWQWLADREINGECVYREFKNRTCWRKCCVMNEIGCSLIAEINFCTNPIFLIVLISCNFVFLWTRLRMYSLHFCILKYPVNVQKSAI